MCHWLTFLISKKVFVVVLISAILSSSFSFFIHHSKAMEMVDVVEHSHVMGLLDVSDASHVVVSNGAWSSPSTWSTGSVPGSGANVHIPDGKIVVYDHFSSIELDFVRVDGELHFATDRNTKMVVDTLFTTHGSVFTVGTIEDPVQDRFKAEIIIANKAALNKSEDPELITRGVVTSGTVAMYGADKESHLRLAVEPNAGDSNIKVIGSTDNWNVGDELVIVGTEYLGTDSSGSLRTQDEVRSITAIAGDIIYLNAPLKYSHKTPSFDVAKSPIKKLYTYVGNLSRNIIIRSEDKNQSVRGHFMMMKPGSDVRYVELRDLGRTDKKKPISDTNVEGRYPLHLHQTGPLTAKHYLVGNAVITSPGWGIVHHSSNAMLYNNVVYNVVGAGIVSEVGDEQGEWIGNLVTKVPGHGNDIPGCPETDNIGCDGDAYFNESRIITQQNNVAANAKTAWNFFGREDLFFYDNGEQAPQTKNGRWRKVFDYDDLKVYNNPFDSAIDHEEPPIEHFNDNTAYAVGTALFVFHRQTSEETDNANSFRRLAAWNLGGRAADQKNYVSNYIYVDSLFLDGGVAIERKTANQSFINTHIENANYTTYSVNHESANIGLTFKNGGMVQKDIMRNVDSDSMRSSLIAQFKGYGLDYVNPLNNIITHASTDGITPVQRIEYILDSSADVSLSPNDENLYISGTFRDSLGERRLNNYIIAQPPQGTGTTQKEFAYLKESSTKKYLSNSEVLKIHGTYKMNNGQWVSPVVHWIGDRLNGVNHPVIIPIKLSGWSDSEMQKYARPWPNPKTNWGDNIVVELPSASGISKPGLYVPPVVDPEEPPVEPEPQLTTANNPYPAGTRIKVSSSVNVRDYYGLTGSLVGEQSVGVMGTTLDEPAYEANGYTWTAVNFDSGVDGWVASDFISVYVPPVPPIDPVNPTLPDNYAPIAGDDLFEFDITGGKTQTIGNVLDNDTDGDNDTLKVSSVTEKRHSVSSVRRNGDNGGRIQINEDGTISVRDNDKFSGIPKGEKIITQIVYEVADPSGLRDEGLVVIEVTNPASGEVMVVEPEQSIDSDGDEVADTLDNCLGYANPDQSDSDNDGVGDACDSQDDTEISEDEAILAEETVEEVSFDEVTAKDDGTLVENLKETTDEMADISAAPQAINDSYQVGNNVKSYYPGNVLDNDLDANGDALEVISTTQSQLEISTFRNGTSGGRIHIATDGEVTFRHGNDFTNLDPGESVQTTILYEISDGNGGTDQATVTFTVSDDGGSVLGASTDAQYANDLENLNILKSILLHLKRILGVI